MTAKFTFFKNKKWAVVACFFACFSADAQVKNNFLVQTYGSSYSELVPLLTDSMQSISNNLPDSYQIQRNSWTYDAQGRIKTHFHSLKDTVSGFETEELSTYTRAPQKLTILKEIKVSPTNTVTQRVTYFGNFPNKPDSTLIENPSPTGLLLTQRVLYSYNSAGNLTSSENWVRDWNATGGSFPWILQNKELRFYDTNGDQVLRESYNYDPQTQATSLWNAYFSKFDNQHREVSVVWKNYFPTEQTVDSIVNFYSTGTVPDSVLLFNWVNPNQIYVKNSIYKYPTAEHKAGRVADVYSVDFTGAAVPQTIHSFVAGTQNYTNEPFEMLQKVRDAQGVLKNKHKKLVSYQTSQPLGHITGNHFQGENTPNGWVETFQATARMRLNTAVAVETPSPEKPILAECGFQNPLPTDQNLRFFDGKTTENVVLNVFDFNGKLVEQAQFDSFSTTKLDGNYADGIYFLTVFEKNQPVCVQKIVIAK
jgi:hypothetical protein